MNKFSIKILKIILTLTVFFTDKEDSVIKFNILISTIYTEAVKDSIWEEM